MRKIDLIVIHCAATPDGRADTIRDIDAWHRQLGWMRSWKHRQHVRPELTSIGYHYFIPTDGLPNLGRGSDEIGAHAIGHNATSIGVCLAGTRKFTTDQWLTLKQVVTLLQERFPGARVAGHRDLPDVKKECPGFDVAAWLAAGMVPAQEHILTKG